MDNRGNNIMHNAMQHQPHSSEVIRGGSQPNLSQPLPSNTYNSNNQYSSIPSSKMTQMFSSGSLPPKIRNEKRKSEGDDIMQLFQETGVEGIAGGLMQESSMKSLPNLPSYKPETKKRLPEAATNPPTSKRSKTGERGTVLGLRDFSVMVCQKVKSKGHTTHTCVADELVQEMLHPTDGKKPVQYDEKNIRRRVYDALNVLMAMGIITKDKKSLKWKGLPSNPFNEIDLLARKKQEQKATIEKKREQLKELLLQQIAFKNLIHRNIKKETEDQKNGEQKSTDVHTKIPLPFIVVSTASSTIIQCEMSEDRSDVFFNFSSAFEIKDDNEILKRLQMHKAPQEMLPHLIPPHLIPYLSADSTRP